MTETPTLAMLRNQVDSGEQPTVTLAQLQRAVQEWQAINPTPQKYIGRGQRGLPGIAWVVGSGSGFEYDGRPIKVID